MTNTLESGLVVFEPCNIGGRVVRGVCRDGSSVVPEVWDKDKRSWGEVDPTSFSRLDDTLANRDFGTHALTPGELLAAPRLSASDLASLM